MPKPITDEALALLGISNAMQKVTTQLEHLGLASQKAAHNVLDVADVGHKLTQRGFMLETVMGHSNQPSILDELFGPSSPRGGGYGAGGGSGGGGGAGGGGGGGGGGRYSSRPRSLSERLGPWGIQQPNSEWYGKAAPMGLARSPEYAAHHWTSKLLNQGRVDPKVIAALHSDLTGGRKLRAKELEHLFSALEKPSASFQENLPGLKQAALEAKQKKEGPEAQLNEEDIKALSRHDKDRVSKKHRDQLRLLLDMSRTRRGRSLKKMEQLTEDNARLNAFEGVERVGYEQQVLKPREEKLRDGRAGVDADLAKLEATPAMGALAYEARKKQLEDRKLTYGQRLSELDFHRRQDATRRQNRFVDQKEKRETGRTTRTGGGTGGGTDALSTSASEAAKSTENLTNWFDRLGRASERLFKKGVLFGSGAAEAASPDTFNTLSGSWKLLLASVGETLQPQIISLAQGLQELAKGFQGLDSGTKKTVGNVVMLGTAALGAVAGLRLVGLAGPIGKGLGALGRTIWHAGTGAVGAGIATFGGIAAAGAFAGLAAHSYYSMRADNQKTLAELSVPVQQEELDNSPHGRAMRGMPAATRARYMTEQASAIQERIDQAQLRYDVLRGVRLPSGDRRSMAGMVFGQAQRFVNPFFGGDHGLATNEELETARNNVVSANRELATLRESGRLASGRGRTAIPQSKKDSAMFAGHQLLLDLVSRTQPGYFSVEDIHKKIQLDALSESPLQQEIRQIQLRQLDALLGYNAKFDELIKAMREAGTLPMPARVR